MPGERRAVLSAARRQLLTLALLLLAAPAGVVWSGAAARPAAAQGPLDKLAPAKPEAAAPEPTLEERKAQLEARRAELEKERAEVVARRGEAATAEEDGDFAAELEAIDRTLGAIADFAGLLEREAQLAGRDDAPPEVIAELGPPPYDLDDLEAVEAALAAAQGEDASHERTQRLVRDELEARSVDLEEREEARRKAREAAELAASGADPVRALAARRALRLAELESERARLRRELAQHGAKAVEAERAAVARDIEQLRAAEARVRADLQVTHDAVDARLARLDALEAQLTREKERTEDRVAERETALVRRQRQLAAASEPAPAPGAQLAALRAELQTERWRASLIGERLAQVAATRELVRTRAAALRGALPREDARKAAEKLAQGLDETRRSLRILETRLTGLREERLRAVSEAARAQAAGSEGAPWKEREARALGDAITAFEQASESLGAFQALQQRAAADLGEEIAGRGVGGTLQLAADAVAEVWDQELASVDDRPITVGKVAVALVVLGLGWLASGLLARLVARVIRRRSLAAEGAAKSIERLAFYVFVALFTLLALRTVNIPLTAFALVGGALAVGVGFGSQNIINNFISGLILLSERPIQIGDIVEVDGVQGEVERIGARSTRIRTFGSVHLIVPNSAFLEKTVVNLTISDDVARVAVNVSAAYGSDTRAVERLLLSLLRAHPLVLEEPGPVVLFDSFGESGLGFLCIVWIRDVLQRGGVASELRHRIDEAFREAGIAHGFPQREIRLAAAGGRPGPLERGAPGETGS